jgi:hypothetical protein
MAHVSISANLTDPDCKRTAETHRRHWEKELTRLGSNGEFKIGHGANGRCADMHSTPWNGS